MSMRSETVNAGDVGPDIRRRIAPHLGRLGRSRLRAILLCHEEGFMLAGWSVRAFLPGTEPRPEPEIRFASAAFVERWLDDDTSLLDALDALTSTNPPHCLGSGIVCLPEPRPARRVTHPGEANAGLPAGTLWSFEGQNLQGKFPRIGDAPLFAADEPLVARPSVRAAAWTEIRRAAPDWHQLEWFSQVSVPETRARISAARRAAKDTVEFTIERLGGYEGELALKVSSWQSGGTDEVCEGAPVAGGVVQVPLFDRATDLLAVLVDSDGSLLDFHEETGGWLSGTSRVLASSGRNDGRPASIADLARDGESDSVEFKPFVRLGRGEAKRDELVKTAAAFANCGGGTILLGVSKSGRIEGIDSDLGKEQRTAKVYREELANYIREELHPTPQVTCHVESLGDRTVVRVIVLPVSERPCVVSRTNEVLVRRGATNRAPEREELVRLCERRARPGGVLGVYS